MSVTFGLPREFRAADCDALEVNVANGNAVYIVRDLLGLGVDDVYGGSIDPNAGAVEPSESQGIHISADGVGPGCRVIDMGRSAAQCASYVRRLRRLAKVAIERGAPSINWG